MTSLETPQSKLRSARLAAGFTQARMAARMRISLGWYSLIEREPSFLSPRLAELAAAILRTSPEELRQ